MANTELTYLVEPFEPKEAPLWFHLRGLSETASGYGGRLRSTRMIRIQGEKVWRRVYVMQYSNAGTAYINVKGEKWIVSNL
jgi:hypothetical protein